MIKRKRVAPVILIPLAIIACLFAAFYNYTALVRDTLEKTGCDVLDILIAQQKNAFDLIIQKQMNSLQAYASWVSQMGLDLHEKKQQLSILTQHMSFSVLGFADVDGETLLSNGDTWNMVGREYFQRALTNESFVANIADIAPSYSNYFAMFTPVLVEGEVAGVLIGFYDMDNVSALLVPAFSEYGFAYLTNSAGLVLAKTDGAGVFQLGDNILDVLSKLEIQRGDKGWEMANHLMKSTPGHSSPIYNGESWLMHYSPVGISDWWIFTLVPESTITVQTRAIHAGSLKLIFIVSGLFALFFVVFFWYQKNSMGRLFRLAFYDNLTGMRNMRKFVIDAKTTLNQNPNRKYCLIKIDIERFKLINELFGHETGDKVLQAVASSIEHGIDPKYEVAARVSGDEFVMLLGYDIFEEISARRRVFEDDVAHLTEHLVNIRLNMPEGRYQLEPGECDLHSIFEKVNFAHRMANNARIVCDYNDEIKTMAVHEQTIENNMENALSNHEYLMFLQPKYSLTDERIVGAEALTRWKPSGANMIFPAEFIPIFEETGFITKLDMYILNEVCRFLRGLLDAGKQPVPISVNFSRLHLFNKNFVQELKAVVDTWGIPPRFIEMELTETTMDANIKILRKTLAELQGYGFSLSMDDFGTGYSSLGLLKHLPLDIIKMDRSFFAGITDQERGKVIIESVISMTKRLNIKTVAEGVETLEHINFLKGLDCDMVQGFYFARPMPEKEFSDLLEQDGEPQPKT